MGWTHRRSSVCFLIFSFATAVDTVEMRSVVGFTPSFTVCASSSTSGGMALALLAAITLLGAAQVTGGATGGGPGCPAGCICDDDTCVVACERGRLDVVPIALNPAIQRLVLRANRIKTVDAAFQFYKQLQYVDLSGNHLVSIPTGSFAHQHELQELHLSKNKLSAVGNRTFEGLSSLTVLNLRENFLEELPARVFAALTRLEELNLGQNRISRIDPAGFDKLPALRVLYLDDNQLRSVPTPSFGALGALAELHVGLNGFATLPDDAFKGLARLAVLDVSGGGVTSIEENAFRGLGALRNLNLADNRLERVPTTQLAPLNRLETLLIGQNDFEVIDERAFAGLANLRKLDLSSSTKLRRVARGALEPNLNLEALSLEGCTHLKDLEPGALLPLPRLRTLSLKGTAALGSPVEGAAPWSSLRQLDLNAAPLHCDCALAWLVRLSADGKNATARDARCSSPAALAGRTLATLAASDLGCSAPGDPRRRAMLATFCAGAGVLLAALALLLCRYRRRVRDALKDYRWSKRAAAAAQRKEREYRQAFADEDGYVVRPPPPLPPAAAAYPMVKPVPVTEL